MNPRAADAHGARLRPAVASDLPALWAVHRAAMRAPVEATWGWDDAAQAARFAAAFAPVFTQCIEVHGATVGLVKVDARGVPVRLLQIAVAPDWQGRGVGTWAVRRVLAGAGTRPVWLQVLHANPRAHALYLRLGFVEIGRTATHVRMWRSLTPVAGSRTA